jgi:hypothetical protein
MVADFDLSDHFADAHSNSGQLMTRNTRVLDFAGHSFHVSGGDVEVTMTYATVLHVDFNVYRGWTRGRGEDEW